MGLFDFFKKKTDVKITFETYEPSRAQIKEQWENESIQRAKARVRNFQKDEAGLYPHEILMLYYAEFYSVNQTDFPQFWRFEYDIDNPMELLKKLQKMGFIREATAKESLSRLNVAELKAILVELGQKTTGKKDDLVKRVAENTTESFLVNRIKNRRFARTEAGEHELSINVYVPYMHSHKFCDISMTDMCILVNKNPGRPFRDILWEEYNRLSLEYMKSGNIGYYRNMRYTMYHFLMEEKRPVPAFELLAETFFYDLNGDIDPIIAPALVNDFRSMERLLDYSDEKIIEILTNLFKNIYAPNRRYSNDEVICIITSYMIGHDEMAETVFNRKSGRK